MYPQRSFIKDFGGFNKLKLIPLFCTKYAQLGTPHLHVSLHDVRKTRMIEMLKDHVIPKTSSTLDRLIVI